MPFEAIIIRDAVSDEIYAFVSCESWGIPLVKDIVKNADSIEDVWDGLIDLEERERLIINVFDSWTDISF